MSDSAAEAHDLLHKRLLKLRKKLQSDMERQMRIGSSISSADKARAIPLAKQALDDMEKHLHYKDLILAEFDMIAAKHWIGIAMHQNR